MLAPRDILIGLLLAALAGVGIWTAARRWTWSQWRRWGWHLLTSCLPLLGVLLLGARLPAELGPTGTAWTSAATVLLLGGAAIWALVGVCSGLFALSSEGAPSDYRFLRGPRTAFLVIWVLISLGVLLDELQVLALGRGLWLVLAAQFWWCAIAPPAFVREEARYRAWQEALGPRRLQWMLLMVGAGLIGIAVLGPSDGWFSR